MKFKKHFEDPVIFPVKLELGGNICQTSPTYGDPENPEPEDGD